MIRQCFLTNSGIRFHADLLKTVGLDPASLYPTVKPRPPAMYSTPSTPSSPSDHTRDASGATLVDRSSVPISEEEEDYVDALCPIYDQLKLAWYWWILEVVPLEHRMQDAEHKWSDVWYANMGHGRKVPTHQPFRVHRSVDIRMRSQNLQGGSYKPNAIFSNQIEWVD